MTAGEDRSRRWLRPLGLLALVLGLAVGQPLVLVAIPFGLLAILHQGTRRSGLFLGALALGFAFIGHGFSGVWYLDRGWAILIGGWFVAMTLARPLQPFLPRALAAVGGGAVWTAAVLHLTDGWERVEWMVRERIEGSASATLELSRIMGQGADEGALQEAVAQTAAAQIVVFPALLALASVAALGVAWWVHVRVSTGSDRAIGRLSALRFSDGLVWLFIAGLVLLLAAGSAEGLGRVGANLLLFSGALYALRGAAVILFVTGGLTWFGGILAGLATVFAAPVVFTGALMVGLGDTWFDLRARVARARDTEEKRDS